MPKSLYAQVLALRTTTTINITTEHTVSLTLAWLERPSQGHGRQLYGRSDHLLSISVTSTMARLLKYHEYYLVHQSTLRDSSQTHQGASLILEPDVLALQNRMANPLAVFVGVGSTHDSTKPNGGTSASVHIREVTDS